MACSEIHEDLGLQLDTQG